MSLDHLPEITGTLLVLPFEDRFGLIRTDTSPAVEVAIVHDGSDCAVGEAKQYAQLLSLSPVMLALLLEALAAWAKRFDGPDDQDLSVSGGDLVDWFSQWRLREQITDQPVPG